MEYLNTLHFFNNIEREARDMSEGKHERDDSPEKPRFSLVRIIEGIVILVVGTFVVTLLVTLFINKPIDTLKTEIRTEFNTLGENIDKRFKEIDERFDAVDKQLQGLDARVSTLEGNGPLFVDSGSEEDSPNDNVEEDDPSSGYVFLKATVDDTYAPVLLTQASEAPSSKITLLAADTLIGIDSNSGAPVTLGTLQREFAPDEYALFAYRDRIHDEDEEDDVEKYHDRETYFLCQYDKDGQWHGRCISNVYIDKSLNIITDANYEHGSLTKYRQAYANTEKGVWYVSERTRVGNHDIGKTYSYHYIEISEAFAYEDVTQNDVWDIERFNVWLKSQELPVFSFYHGDISDGKYNDLSGTAYYIQYFSSDNQNNDTRDNDDHNVQTLYVGDFVGGAFNGRGQMIGKMAQDQPAYAYYIGDFEGGYPKKASEDGAGEIYGVWEYGLTQQEIDDKINAIISNVLSGNDFEEPLTGLYDNPS